MTKKQNISDKQWVIQVDDYDQLNVEVLSKINAEAEKYFDSLVKDICAIRLKAYTTLSIFIPLESIVLGFLINKIGINLTDIQTLDTPLVILVFTLLIILTFCIFTLILIIFPKKMMVPGEQAYAIDFNQITALKKAAQLKAYIFNSIENNQNKINFNEYLLSKNIVNLSGF